MCKTLFIFLVSICFLTATAQNDKSNLLFSPDTTVVTRAFPSIGLDNRLSFIDGRLTTFTGVRAGIRFGAKRHRLTAAYRWFSYADDTGLFDVATIINPRYITQLEANYYSLSYQHILIDKYRYAFGATFDVGLGAAYDEDLSYFQNLNIFKKPRKFVPIQVGIYSEWKATRFVGLTGQFGYRQALNYEMQPSISKLYLGLGARLYIGSIIRYVFKGGSQITKSQ
ncbi:MAG: hypothetical protein NWQ46_03930 [Spirosomaceae bacterium]|nr:hypothetical protein [Spirosomataceae bacterium]